MSEDLHNPYLFDKKCDGRGDAVYETPVTLLDLFAAFALAGINANPNIEASHEARSQMARQDADAMLAERERK